MSVPVVTQGEDILLLTDLPHDLLRAILSQLHKQSDFGSLRLVCHILNSISTPYFFHDICLRLSETGKDGEWPMKLLDSPTTLYHTRNLRITNEARGSRLLPFEHFRPSVVPLSDDHVELWSLWQTLQSSQQLALSCFMEAILPRYITSSPPAKFKRDQLRSLIWQHTLAMAPRTFVKTLELQESIQHLEISSIRDLSLAEGIDSALVLIDMLQNHNPVKSLRTFVYRGLRPPCEHSALRPDVEYLVGPIIKKAASTLKTLRLSAEHSMNEDGVIIFDTETRATSRPSLDHVCFGAATTQATKQPLKLHLDTLELGYVNVRNLFDQSRSLVSISVPHLRRLYLEECDNDDLLDLLDRLTHRADELRLQEFGLRMRSRATWTTWASVYGDLLTAFTKFLESFNGLEVLSLLLEDAVEDDEDALFDAWATHSNSLRVSVFERRIVSPHPQRCFQVGGWSDLSERTVLFPVLDEFACTEECLDDFWETYGREAYGSVQTLHIRNFPTVTINRAGRVDPDMPPDADINVWRLPAGEISPDASEIIREIFCSGWSSNAEHHQAPKLKLIIIGPWTYGDQMSCAGPRAFENINVSHFNEGTSSISSLQTIDAALRPVFFEVTWEGVQEDMWVPSVRALEEMSWLEIKETFDRVRSLDFAWPE